MQQRAVCGHDHGREGWIIRLHGDDGLRLRRVGLVVCEDLVDAEGDVGEEEGGFDRVAAAGEDAPRAEDED